MAPPLIFRSPGDLTTARRQARYHLLWLSLAVAILGLAALCSASDDGVALPGMLSTLPELCLLRRWTGWECPGCGLTRSLVALAHGEVAQAWRFHPAGWLLFAALLWQILYRTAQLGLLRSGREIAVRRGVTAGVVLVFVAACAAQWIAQLAGLPS